MGRTSNDTTGTDKYKSRHLQFVKNFIEPGSHAGDIIKMVNVNRFFLFLFLANLFYFLIYLIFSQSPCMI